MRRQIGILLSKFLVHPPVFYSMSFQCCEYLWDVYNINFLQVTLPQETFILSVTTTLLISSINESSGSSSNCIVSWRAWVHLQSPGSSLTTLPPHCLSSLHLNVCCPMPSFSQLFSPKYMWVYHWQMRKQHDLMLCCVCINLLSAY